MTAPMPEAFLNELAAKTPAPGGGAAVGLTGAIAAALTEMVLAYSVDRRSLSEHRPALAEAQAAAQRARTEFLRLAERDAECYRSLNRLQRLPEGDPERAGIPATALAATQVPLDTAHLGLALLRLADGLAGRINPLLASDLRIAAKLAEAVVRSSEENVGANLDCLDEGERRRAASEIARLTTEAAALLERAVGRAAEPGSGGSPA